MPQPHWSYGKTSALVSIAVSLSLSAVTLSLSAVTLSLSKGETLPSEWRTWGMRYSRGGIIAVLLAAEIFIGGAILWLLGGHGSAGAASGLHAVSESGKTFDPIDAGNDPHVIIDDSDSRVAITASTDGLVHVTDATSLHGLFWGQTSRPALQVTRTPDGVSIFRPGDNQLHFSIFGFSDEHIDVAVPAASMLDVRQCSGADVSGLTGQLRVHSVDGHIALNHVHAGALTLASDDGRLRFDDVSAPSIDASTNDGSIRATALQVGAGRLHTGDGSIRLNLLASDLTVHAQTSDGSLYFNGDKTVSDDDSVSRDFRIGSGGNSLQVSTQDGSIHITTNGAN